MPNIYKKRKGVIHVPQKATVYVPGTNKQQKKLTPSGRSRRINQVRKYLSNKYGGFTSVRATGGWVPDKGKDKGKVVQEPVSQVTSFSKAKKFKKGDMYNQLVKWGQKWGQEEMGFEYEGDFYRVIMPKKGVKKIAKRKKRKK